MITKDSRIKEVVKKYGVENLIILAKMKPLHDAIFIHYTSSDDEDVLVPCTIDETNYTIEEDYKITLKPMIPGYASESYYQMDFNNLREKDIVIICLKINYKLVK